MKVFRMLSAPSSSQSVKKEFILMMAALMSIVAISIDAMLPALGLIGADLRAVNDNQAQLVISFIFAGMTIGQLISGPLSDAIGRKKIVFYGLALYFTGALICLNATSMTMIFTGRFIQGLGVSGPFIASQSIVRDKYSGRAMARILSLVMMIFIMVPAIAPALGMGIIALASWRAIFAFYILYAAAIGFWLYRRLDETLAEENRIPFRLSTFKHGLKTVFGNATTMRYTVAVGCAFGAMIGYLTSIQQIYFDIYDLGDLFPLFFGLQALAFGASSFINSRIVEKYGMRYIVLRIVLFICFLSAGLATVQLFTMPPFWIFFIFGICILFSIAMLFGNLNALAMEPMGQMAGIAAAIIGAVSSVIGISAGTLIGQLYNGTLFPMSIGFLCLGTIAILLILSDRNPVTTIVP